MNATDTVDQRIAAGKIGPPNALDNRAIAIAVAVLNILDDVGLGSQDKPLRRAKRDMKWSDREQIAQNDYNSNSRAAIIPRRSANREYSALFAVLGLGALGVGPRAVSVDCTGYQGSVGCGSHSAWLDKAGGRMLGSGTKSDDGGGTIGSGTRTGSTS